MIDWAVTEDGFRVRDADNSELPVGAPDATTCDSASGVPRPVDDCFDCVASELRFPVSIVYVTAVSTGKTHELGTVDGSLSLPADEYVVEIDAEIKTYVTVNGAVSVRKTDDYEAVVVATPGRTRMSLGFRSRHASPAATLTVPPTPTGLATALSHLPSSHKTTGTERSYPTLRGHPPLVETSDPDAEGDGYDLPEQVRAATPSTGIEVAVPASFEPLFAVAPLAYYLQATVTAEDREAPMIRAPAVGMTHELPAVPSLERAVTRLLRKVFFMDCLVRNAGDRGTDLAETSVLDALRLDAGDLYEMAPANRLDAYLAVPYSAIEQRLPDWHLATYVAPGPENVGALPYLLDSLSLVYRPETSELAGGELVERSLDDFYRGGGRDGDRRGAGEVATVDVVKPELQAGRVHGWLADGVPIDVFKTDEQAYRNRERYRDRPGDTVSVVVVLNDDEMAEEHVDVRDIYRNRAEEIPLEVTVHEHCTRAELRAVFESETEYVHYIGHCEADGLRCADGYLAAADLDTCNAETFFLNACGSFHEGMGLIEQGSVAGAVTFSQVMNDHAVKVGSAFARLLVNGFGMERALRLARRRIMMGKDYAVVGDGTHSLTQNTNRLPATAELQSVEEDTFLLTYDQYSTRNTGGFYRPYLDGTDYAYLCGNESEFALDRSSVVEFLQRAELPVIYDGDFYWSDELSTEL